MTIYLNNILYNTYENLLEQSSVRSITITTKTQNTQTPRNQKDITPKPQKTGAPQRALSEHRLFNTEAKERALRRDKAFNYSLE
jgi:hypothetical protein